MMDDGDVGRLRVPPHSPRDIANPIPITPLERLLALPRFADRGATAYKPGLDRMRALMDRMGRPERAYPTLHVGGTNGKGSTASMAAAILTAAGHRVGLHTSPHLLELGERMRVDGRPMPNYSLEAAAERHEALFDSVGASFFEATTALAFEYFATAGVDVAVVEVGLGGRFDATNVLDPMAAAVTNVGLDHTDILGSTVAEIAREKGGIAKPGVPFLTTANGEALEVLHAAANAAGALFEDVAETVDLRPEAPGIWHLITSQRDYGVVEIALPGAHQGHNAALAVRLAEVAAPRLAREAVRAGLRDVVALAGLRGRGETLAPDRRVILDVAHNPDGWTAAIGAMDLPEGGRLHAVVGVMADKDAGALAAELARAGAAVFAAELPSDRAAPAAGLTAAMRAAGVDVAVVGGTVAEGLAWFRGRGSPADRLLVTGSHVTVTEAIRAAAVGENTPSDGRA